MQTQPGSPLCSWERHKCQRSSGKLQRTVFGGKMSESTILYRSGAHVQAGKSHPAAFMRLSRGVIFRKQLAPKRRSWPCGRPGALSWAHQWSFTHAWWIICKPLALSNLQSQRSKCSCKRSATQLRSDPSFALIIPELPSTLERLTWESVRRAWLRLREQTICRLSQP